MITNADCTIYSRYGELWKKQYIPECWWFKETKSSITTEGLKSADVLNVRIPDLSYEVDKDDIIVKGNLALEIQTVKDLKGIEYFKVTTVNRNDFGCPHIYLEAV